MVVDADEHRRKRVHKEEEMVNEYILALMCEYISKINIILEKSDRTTKLLLLT